MEKSQKRLREYIILNSDSTFSGIKCTHAAHKIFMMKFWVFHYCYVTHVQNWRYICLEVWVNWTTCQNSLSVYWHFLKLSYHWHNFAIRHSWFWLPTWAKESMLLTDRSFDCLSSIAVIFWSTGTESVEFSLMLFVSQKIIFYSQTTSRIPVLSCLFIVFTHTCYKHTSLAQLQASPLCRWMC